MARTQTARPDACRKAAPNHRGFFKWIWHTVLIFLGVCVLLVISAEGSRLGQLVSLLAAFLIFPTVQLWPAPPSFDKQEPDQDSHET